MDRNRHFTQTILLTLHLTLLCIVLCLSGGCEEAVVNSPPVTGDTDLEAVAEVVENAFVEMGNPSPEDFVEEVPVAVAASDSVNAAIAGSPEEFAGETGDVEVEMAVAVEAGPVAIVVEEVAMVDDGGSVHEIFAESAQPMAEEASEKEATAELAERIGLEYPIPATSLGLGNNGPDPAVDLDKMRLADVSLLAEDAKPGEGNEDIQPSTAESEVPVEEAEPKGFAAKFILTPCGAVAGFAKRHWFISGAAIVFVAGLIVVKKRNLSFSNPWRKWTSGR